MLHRIFATLATTLFGVAAAAECTGESFLDLMAADERAQVQAAADNTPFGKGIHWEARKDDKLITVVGTMHIYDQRLEPIRATLKDTVQTADLILLEGTPVEQAQLQQLIAAEPERIFITDGPTLPDLLDEETWSNISDAAKARSLPPFLAAKMQPWYLALTLAVPPCTMLDMASGKMGLDHMIMEDAEAAGVPMQALEPYTTLFDIFEQDPLEEQIDMLRVNLGSPDQQEQMFVAMLDRYFAQDLATLWEMSRVAMQNAPGMDLDTANELFAESEKALLTDRNRNWMPVINTAAEQHDSLVVAVGGIHLIGTEGILYFLQDDGWDLTRVN